MTLCALRRQGQLSHPPRLLFTWQPNAAIVGPPDDRAIQLATLRAAFQLLVEATAPGEFQEMARESE